MSVLGNLSTSAGVKRAAQSIARRWPQWSPHSSSLVSIRPLLLASPFSSTPLPQPTTTAAAAQPQDENQVPRNQRERELILSVLSTVPSPREARKFLNSVSGSETMRTQRQFEEQQAQLAATQPQTATAPIQSTRAVIPEETPCASRQQAEPVARRLTAAVFIDGSAQSPLACQRMGKLLAQIQRLGVAPVVLLSGALSDGSGYRQVIRDVHKLADAIESEGGRARPVNEGVFYTNPYSRAEVSVDAELIGSAIAQGRIPIVSPLVANHSLQVQVLGADVAAPALARALAQSTSQQHAMPGSKGQFSLLLARLIMLSAADGLSASNGTFHRFVNLQEDFDSVLYDCRQADTLKLMRDCLGILPPTAAGIVASVNSDPSLVMKGLISERPVSTQHQSAMRRLRFEEDAQKRRSELSKQGVPDYKPLSNYPFGRIGDAIASSANKQSAPGSDENTEVPTQFTLLRHGFRIQRHRSLDSCNLPRLRSLLESSFKRTLNGGQYFDRLRERAKNGGIEIIVAGDYEGAVIVTHEPIPGLGGHLPYLDKFAVLPSVQGTGMADILWAQLKRACPSCMWRSRNDNGVNKWYFDRSSGHFRSKPLAPGEKGTRWVFFWYQSTADAGRTDQHTLSAQAIHAGIDVANAIAPSFV
ncbi:Amino-acid acetyltransferase, mitochondrial [Coemansia sp. Benny D115]|nr:Amino-acid acetyltransferase, mitochondrial [Coemansia sp. Benny D115]